MLPKTRARALWIAVSTLAALFVATELTPRTSNSSRTLVGQVWTRLGLTGLYGSVRDGELAGFNEFYVKRTESGLQILTNDDIASSYDMDRDHATKIREFEPDYLIRAQVTYRWGGFVYKSWLRLNYSFLVADPDTGNAIGDPQLVRELQLATADWLEGGKLSWKKWKAPRWPSDLRAGETNWQETYTRAYFWDAVWCVLLLFALISIGYWLRLEYRQFKSRTIQGSPPE